MDVSERYRSLSLVWYIVLFIFSVTGIFIAIDFVFVLQLPNLLHNQYLYLFLLLYLSSVFILFPPTRAATREKIPWYDVIIVLLCVSTCGYLAAVSLDISTRGWAAMAPMLPTVASFILWALVLEAVRRSSGLVLFAVCFILSIFPLFSTLVPGMLKGYSLSLVPLALNHALSSESILGITLELTATLVIGFMFFGVAMVHTGGGRFLFNTSLALLGSFRGGPAKVAVIASAMFGSMSGSPMSNVITTGSITIPLMKRLGYPSYFAGAVEAVASTGGCLMPPVMGAAAFIMAGFLGVPYLHVVIAAAIPSILFYIGLFVQIDARAVKLELKGIPKSEKPPLGQTLKAGWFYIVAFIALIYFLVYVKVESWAPFYATALLIGLAMIRKETRFTLKNFGAFIVDTTRTMAEITAILAAIGLIIGSLSITGVAGAFSQELVSFTHGNVLLLLFLGALTSAILGMGMTMSACYIFLAVVMIPALVGGGINVFAAHLFVMYWGMISCITPPVCGPTYTAATIAGSNGIRTAFQAMRLGIILYIVPFLFVLDPALVAQTTILEMILPFLTTVAGVILISAALEGYLIGLGRLTFPLRFLSFASGMLLAIPGWHYDLIGLGVAIAIIFVNRLAKRF